MIGAQAASAAEPDGYTLYMPIASTFTVLPETQFKLPLDLHRDLTPIGLVGEEPMLIAVHPSLGVNTLAELIALARKRPGDVLYGGGRGTVPHLAGELFRRRAGIEVRPFVPYPSVARARQDTVGGTLTLLFDSPSSLSGPLQAGLKALAVASSKRLPNLPDVPTVGEAVPELGLFEVMGWSALMAPAATPSGVTRKLREDLRAVLSQPGLKQKIRGNRGLFTSLISLRNDRFHP